MKTVISLFFLIVFPCFAQTNALVSTNAPHPAIGQNVSLTLKDGTVKTGKIVEIDPEGVSILTDDGGGKVLYANMTEAEQEIWGYAPAKVEAFHQQEKNAVAAARSERARYEANEAALEKQENDAKAWAERLKRAYPVTGAVFQITNDGVLMWRYHTVSDGVYAPMDSGIVFINGLKGDFTSNEVVTTYVIDDGTLTYTTVIGMQNTIPKFTVVPWTNGAAAGAYVRVEDAGPPPPEQTHFRIDDVAR